MSAMSQKRKEHIAVQHRERRESLKAQHRCIACGDQDDRTLAGRVLCNACALKQKASTHSRRKQQGLCVQCGAADSRTQSGLSLCAQCADQRSQNARAWYWRRRENRLCIDCGKQDQHTLDGNCRCLACVERQKIKWMRYSIDRKLGKKPKQCKGLDCFNCPYPDCIVDEEDAT